MKRPAAGEFAPFYADYVARVPDGELLTVFEAQLEEGLALFDALDPAQAHARYAPGKWSVQEVLGHVIDTAWIFTYRALRFARADATPLPGMDQDEFVAHSNADRRELSSLRTEFEHVNRAALAFFGSLDTESWERRGVASNCEFTVRALGFIVVGHTASHFDTLRERYGLGG